LQRNPPGSALLGAHFTRGKNWGLRKSAVSGKLVVGKQELPGQPDYADPPSEAGFAILGFGVAASRSEGRRAADSARSDSVHQDYPRGNQIGRRKASIDLRLACSGASRGTWSRLQLPSDPYS
jgi:hypothetical protein